MLHDPSSFRSILVPLDGSPFAEQAVPLAARIAQRSDSKLHLAFVHEPPAPPVDSAAAKLFTSIEAASRKVERAYRRGVQARLREGGTRLSSAVTLTGDPGAAIAEEALDTGARLARALDTELSLLQVVPPVLLSDDPALPLPSAYDEELTGMCRTQAQDYLDDVVECLHAQGVRATGVAVVGWSPVDSILEVARPDQIALVVLATHGPGGLRRLALGSVADKLVRGADVPVLVYRPAGAGTTKMQPSSRVGSRGRLAHRAHHSTAP